MNHITAFAIAAFLALSGCFTLQSVEQVGPDTYRFSVKSEAAYPMAADQANQIDHYSMERCPNGYEMLSEQVTKVNGQPTYNWTVRCLNPN